MIRDEHARPARDEKKYEQLLQSALDAYAAVIVVDLDDRILYANKQWCDIWGYEDGPPEVVDTKLLTLARTIIHDVDAFEARIAYLRDHPHETSFELIQFRDGRIFERFTSPLYVADELSAQIWAFRDLSDRLSPSLLTPSGGLISDQGELARRLASTSSRVRDFVSRRVDDMCETCMGLVSLLHDAIESGNRDDESSVVALSRYTRMHTATGLGCDPGTIDITGVRGGAEPTIHAKSDILLGAELFLAGLVARTTGGDEVCGVRIRDTSLEIAGPCIGVYPQSGTHPHLDIARDCVDLIREQTSHTKTVQPGLVTFTRFPFGETAR